MPGSTAFFCRPRATLRPLGALAQLGERRLCKPEVTGSIPVRSTADKRVPIGAALPRRNDARFSQPDVECASEDSFSGPVRQLDQRDDPTADAPCVPRRHDARRPGKQVTSRGLEPRDGPSTAAEGHAQAVASQSLGDIAEVRYEQLQPAGRAGAPDSQPPQLEPAGDLSRSANDDDDPQAHPYCDPRTTHRTARQHDERIVISSAGASRHGRRDPQ